MASLLDGEELLASALDTPKEACRRKGDEHGTVKEEHHASNEKETSCSGAQKEAARQSTGSFPITRGLGVRHTTGAEHNPNFYSEC